MIEIEPIKNQYQNLAMFCWDVLRHGVDDRSRVQGCGPIGLI
jgi:hypothetical protein